jgi:hypothetical protein
MAQERSPSEDNKLTTLAYLFGNNVVNITLASGYLASTLLKLYLDSDQNWQPRLGSLDGRSRNGNDETEQFWKGGQGLNCSPTEFLKLDSNSADHISRATRHNQKTNLSR